MVSGPPENGKNRELFSNRIRIFSYNVAFEKETDAEYCHTDNSCPRKVN